MQVRLFQGSGYRVAVLNQKLHFEAIDEFFLRTNVLARIRFGLMNRIGFLILGGLTWLNLTVRRETPERIVRKASYGEMSTLYP